jgi:hypothetical protein
MPDGSQFNRGQWDTQPASPPDQLFKLTEQGGPAVAIVRPRPPEYVLVAWCSARSNDWRFPAPTWLSRAREYS